MSHSRFHLNADQPGSSRSYRKSAFYNQVEIWKPNSACVTKPNTRLGNTACRPTQTHHCLGGKLRNGRTCLNRTEYD
ncbi:hypothetical protein DERP_010108 [Dermatophagoides pteronyssinus]|uniref:Uncharacterized protein n=1 Tax=Dermatophagoides pteronyssinus TaxID=6956 RepID=A0ABQ8JFF8_DERPT|nr:hypothetical protein DERP_010108 [Dermatophagoides pteronyssinus]